MSEIITRSKTIHKDAYLEIIRGFSQAGTLLPENVTATAKALNISPDDRIKQLVNHAWGLSCVFSKKWQDEAK